MKFGLQGPRSAAWMVAKVAAGSLPSFVARHHRWVRDAEIPAKSRSVHEHFVLSKALDAAACNDRLNIKN